jgi:serine/threonine-protein kinase
MAELFLGFTSGPGGFRKYVALKRVLPDVRSHERFVRMFLDEARITAALNHPNICQVFELGESEDGLFLALELIAGQNLQQVASACRRRGQPVPPGLSLAVARDVCLALHYAHAFSTPGGKPSPVIHRDVSQKNVMVTYDGVVKLLDFGIAKARDSLERTQVGVLKGTLGYMSPEQLRGEPLDGRSDLYCVGVMLYELLRGQRLFPGVELREQMARLLTEPIPELRPHVPRLPPEVSAVVMKALARNRDERFSSGRELARALEQAAGPLLFDSEQRAAFMCELFAAKREATRRLLESVDVPGPETDAEAVRALKEDGEEASSALPETRAAEVEPVTLHSITHPGMTGEAPKPEPVPEPEPGKKTGTGVLAVAAGLVLLVAGGSFLAFQVEPEPEAELPVGDVSPLQPIAPPAGFPRAESVPARQEPPKATQEEAVVVQEAPAPKVVSGQGKLTLVIQPDAKVYLGSKLLGKTPLFNKSLPAGTHLLRVVGTDGKKRQLSVPIEQGKVTQFRIELRDIPEQ